MSANICTAGVGANGKYRERVQAPVTRKQCTVQAVKILQEIGERHPKHTTILFVRRVKP
jgi:hypothetical protein